MNVDDLDLPPGIFQTLENDPLKLGRPSVSSIANLNKAKYVSNWLHTSSRPEITENTPIKSQVQAEKADFFPAGWDSNNMSNITSKKSLKRTVASSDKQKEALQREGKKSPIKPDSSTTPAMANHSDSEWDKMYENQLHMLSKVQQNGNNEQFRKQMKCAVGLCTCVKCQQEVPHELTWQVDEFQKPKQSVEHQTPPPLMKTDDSLVGSMMTAPSLQSNSMEMNKSVVLTHGQTIPRPQEEISRTNLNPKIQACLKVAGFERSKPVQSFGWPAIMRGHNVVIIHGRETGKTLTYMSALCSHLIDCDGRYERIPDSKRSPLLIILANDASVAEEVYSKLSHILKGNPLLNNIWQPLLPLSSKKIVQFFNTNITGHSSKKTRTKQIQLDILITTTDTLIVLLNEKVIDLKRLRHFVVENINIILEKLAPRLQLVLNAVESMLSHRNCYDGVQFICTGEKWTKKVEHFITKLYTFPLIIIGNPMQAALYGRAQLQLQFVEEGRMKPELLADLFESVRYYIYKCIVVCKPDEICNIEEQFAIRGINFVSTTDNMHGAQVVDLLMSWKTTTAGKHIVLICTDKAIRQHIKVSNASFLVNYSLPPTWSIFSKRFSTLIDSYLCPLTSTFKQNKFYCQVVTYVDKNCLDRCTRISNFFTSNGLKVPDILQQFCKEQVLNAELEKVSANVKLCKRLLTLGACKNHECKERHTISKTQENAMHSPANGLITCRLVNMRAINHYYLQILEFTDLDRVVHTIPDYAAQVAELLEGCSGFNVAADAVKGKTYLYAADKQFYRCILRRIVKYILIGDTMTDNPLEVEIFGLENGIICVTNVNKLYEIPTALAMIPPSAVEVYVANIIPPFKESIWTRNANKMLSEKLRGFDSTAVCRGNILLRLNDTIWIEDLEIRQMEGPFLNRLSITQWLKKKHIFDSSSETIHNLYRLCKEGGVALPDYKVLEEEISKEPKFMQAEASWAHLSLDELNAVYFSSASSSDCIYVKHAKFLPLLKNLEESIASSRLLKRHLDSDEVMAGQYYCLADEGSGDWCRVLLVEVIDNIATCFFVDYGDYQSATVDKLRFLTNEHLTRLPFQAIECSLYGVKSSSSVDLVDKLYELCYEEPGSDIYQTWYAYILATETATHGGGKKYRIVLLDNVPNASEVSSMNSIVVNQKLAENIEDESLENLDLPETETADESDEALYKRIKDLPVAMQLNFDDWDVYEHGIVIGTDEIKEEKKDKEIEERCSSGGYLPMTVAPKTDTKLVPRINWYQTISHVFMEFMFIEIGDYKIHVVRNRFLTFSTSYKGNDFTLNMNLFNTVKKSFTHEPKTHFLSIVLTKEKIENWPKLAKSEEKMGNIKYKTEKIEISDSDEGEEDCFLQSKDIDDRYFRNAVLTTDGRIEEYFSDYDDTDSDYGDGLEDN